MILVLDASAAIELALGRKRGQEIVDKVKGASLVTAPDVFVPEVGNVLWKCQRFEKLKREDMKKALGFTLALCDDYVASVELVNDAVDVAIQSGLTVYDSLYLVTALKSTGTLMTMDKRLVKSARALNVPCF